MANPTNARAMGQKISIKNPLISLIVIKNLLFIQIEKSFTNLDLLE